MYSLTGSMRIDWYFPSPCSSGAALSFLSGTATVQLKIEWPWFSPPVAAVNPSHAVSPPIFPNRPTYKFGSYCTQIPLGDSPTVHFGWRGLVLNHRRRKNAETPKESPTVFDTVYYSDGLSHPRDLEGLLHIPKNTDGGQNFLPLPLSARCARAWNKQQTITTSNSNLIWFEFGSSQRSADCNNISGGVQKKCELLWSGIPDTYQTPLQA